MPNHFRSGARHPFGNTPCMCHNIKVNLMSNSSTPVRDEDVRDTEGQNPSETESSFGDILNQFEQSHAHEATPAKKGADATVAAVVVAVNADSVFFDVGQKTEGVLPLAALATNRDRSRSSPAIWFMYRSAAATAKAITSSR